MAREKERILVKAMQDNEDSETPQSVQQRVKHFSTAFMKSSNSTAASSTEKVRGNTQSPSSGGSSYSTCESRVVSHAVSSTDETPVRRLEEMRGQFYGSAYSHNYSKTSEKTRRRPSIATTVSLTKKSNTSPHPPNHETTTTTGTMEAECFSAHYSSSVPDLSEEYWTIKSADTLESFDQRGPNRPDADIEMRTPIDETPTYSKVFQIREMFSPKNFHHHFEPRAKSVQPSQSNLSARWPDARLARARRESDFSLRGPDNSANVINTITPLRFCHARSSPRPAYDVTWKYAATASRIPSAEVRSLTCSNSASEVKEEIASLQAQRNVHHVRTLFARNESLYCAKQRAHSAHQFPMDTHSEPSAKNYTGDREKLNKDGVRQRGCVGADGFRAPDGMTILSPLVRCQERSRTTKSRRQQQATKVGEVTTGVRWVNAAGEMEGKKKRLRDIFAKELFALRMGDTLEDDAHVEVRRESEHEITDSRRCGTSDNRKRLKQYHPLMQYSKYWLITCWLSWVRLLQNRAVNTIIDKENTLNCVVKENVNASKLQCISKAGVHRANCVNVSRMLSSETRENSLLLKRSLEGTCTSSTDTECWKLPFQLSSVENETVSRQVSNAQSPCVKAVARLEIPCKTGVLPLRWRVDSSEAKGNIDSSTQWCHRSANLRCGSGTVSSADATEEQTNVSSSRTSFFTSTQKVSADVSASCSLVASGDLGCRSPDTLQEPRPSQDDSDPVVDVDPTEARLNRTCQYQDRQRNLNFAKATKRLSKNTGLGETLSNWRKDVATGDKQLKRNALVTGKLHQKVFNRFLLSSSSKPSSNEQLDSTRNEGESRARAVRVPKSHKEWCSTSPRFDRDVESVNVKQKIDQYCRNGNSGHHAGRSLSPHEFLRQNSSGSSCDLDTINDLQTYVEKRSERIEQHRPSLLADTDNLAFGHRSPLSSASSSPANLRSTSKSSKYPELQARISGARGQRRNRKASPNGRLSPEARTTSRSLRFRAIVVVKTTLGKSAKAHRLNTSTRANAFRRFIDAGTIASIVDAFNKLIASVPSNPQVKDGNKFPFERLEALKGLPWKARDVWKNLAKQLQPPKLKGHKIIIVGAGPCGLRAALCAVSYGAEVVVLEKRQEFVRKNRLHIWECMKADVVDWNGKIFTPPGPQFGMDQDYTHIGIAELQLLLFKNCLLLGVELKTNVMCTGVTPKSDYGCGWTIDTSDGQMDCNVVIGADGPASNFSKLVPGLSGSVSLELKNAIGLVVNFVNEDSVRSRLRQFSWSKQFNDKMFADLARNAGADLENIVYYRGPDTHYFVMTPTAQTIQNNHICDQVPIGSRSVINYDNLRAFARKITVHLGFSKHLRFLGDDSASPGALRQDCMLFDFSSTRRATDSVVFTGGNGAPAALVGDALLEPFWPEGLGIIRGFFSVFDVVHAIATWAENGQQVAERDATQAWTSLKSLNAHNRAHIVREQFKEYGVNPRTRYRGFV